MGKVVALRDIVDAMEMSSVESQSYLNVKTGEIVTVTEEDRRILDGDEDEQDLPEWQREDLAKIREVLESGHSLALPSQFEIHEWSIMERFCLDVKDDGMREELLDAIHGTGAFRSFRRTSERLGVRDDWYDFRQAELEQIAKEWLEDNEIPYE